MDSLVEGGCTSVSVGEVVQLGRHRLMCGDSGNPEHVARGVETGHPAVFPIALPTEIIRAYTDPGEVVFEPFAGSGTTLLAAEREGRTCYAMEIEPSYCDIAIARFAKEVRQ